MNKRVASGIGAGLILASASLLAFLGRWEGESEFVVYADKLANGLPTVCKGLTHHVTRTPIIVGDVWTPEQCAREEAAAVTNVQLDLLPCFKVPPPQSVFDAASSHAWNNGTAKTCGSQAMKAWNRGEWAKGCRLLSRKPDGTPNWAIANGKLVRGLVNRREAETRLCIP